MHAAVTVGPQELFGFLPEVPPERPVFIWGPPGIGKSAIVNAFAGEVGLPCVSMLGSQLAPEDLIGVPQIIGDTSRFCPPRSIARTEPYVLFLDELNACSHEVQKAFYSLIHDRKLGEYALPAGSVVVGAGNRAQDSAIVKPLSSALVNRMVHVHLRVVAAQWIEWAHKNELHPWVIELITLRPDYLHHQPPKHEEPFSTPRSWHMLSDALKAWGRGPDGGEPNIDDKALTVVAHGCLSPHHASQFVGFVKQVRNKYGVEHIIDGKASWPREPDDRDVLYFLAQTFRARLAKELPKEKERLNDATQKLAHRSKALLKELATISLEIAQMVVTEGDPALPGWFLIDVARELPRLVDRDRDKEK